MDKRILKFAPGSGNIVGTEGREFSEAVLATLRVSDPVISDLVLGYKNADAVAPAVFPDFEVPKEAGKVPGVGREDYLRWETTRALRGPTKHMEFKTGSISFELEEHSLGFGIDDREVEEWAVTVDTLKAIRQRKVNMALTLEKELNAAYVATTAGNYGAAKDGSSLNWAASGATGDPVADLLAQRETIRKQIGLYPTDILFDPTAWLDFRLNPNALAYLSKFVAGGTPQSLIYTEMLAAMVLEVKRVHVGKMIYATGAVGFGDTPTTTADVWSVIQTGNVVLWYGGTGIEEPSFGLNFFKKGYPKATGYRWEKEHSDIYETQHIWQQKMTLAGAGQLIYGIV